METKSLQRRGFVWRALGCLCCSGSLVVACTCNSGKQALPLRASVLQLEHEDLRPFVLTNRVTKAEVIAHLGTRECACWTVRETSGEFRDISVFVAYLTASFEKALDLNTGDFYGFPRMLNRHRGTLTVMARSGAIALPVEIREYAKADRSTCVDVRVLYANGRFYSDDGEVSRIMKPAYLSKVEVAVQLDSRTTMHQATDSATRFLQTLLPALLDHYWPGE